jgi:hypothetical protein
VEIIIYRQLLDASGVEVPPPFIPRSPTVEAGTMRRTAIEKQERGPIGISKCDIENEIENKTFVV